MVWTTDSTADGVRPLTSPQEVRMPDSQSDQKSELECLRLASDLMEMANQTLNPKLKAHCLRMAGVWTDQAEREPKP